MRKGTEKKRGAVICAAVIVGLLAIVLAMFMLPVLGAMYEDAVVAVILIVYGAVIAAVIVGVLCALRERLREIEGGEEEDAKKY